MSNVDSFKDIDKDIKSIGDDLFDFIKERDNWIYDSKQRSIYSNRHQTFQITCFYDDRK